jgi:hypothetical protein
VEVDVEVLIGTKEGGDGLLVAKDVAQQGKGPFVLEKGHSRWLAFPSADMLNYD